MNGISEIGLFRSAVIAPARVADAPGDASNPSGAPARSDAVVSGAGVATDVVELSPQATLVADLSLQPDIRVDKVAQIRAEIESGQYDLTLDQKLAAVTGSILADVQSVGQSI